MKNFIVAFLLGAAAGAAVAWFARAPAPASEPAGHPEEKEVEVSRGTNGSVTLHLKKSALDAMGIKTGHLAQTNLAPEIKAYGKVVDPSALAALLAERESARAAFEASKSELDRLEALFQQDRNVSVRAVQAARSGTTRDEMLLRSTEDRLKVIWGRTIAGQTNLNELADRLVKQEQALIRIDLPLGTTPSNAVIREARILSAAAPERPARGTFLGSAGSGDPLSLGRSLFFLAQNQSADFVPGMAVTAYCLTANEGGRAGYLIPRAALLRAQGENWIYCQEGDLVFHRQVVDLRFPVEEGWLAAVEPGIDGEVVLSGAQQLYSAEISESLGGEE